MELGFGKETTLGSNSSKRIDFKQYTRLPPQTDSTYPDF